MHDFEGATTASAAELRGLPVERRAAVGTHKQIEERVVHIRPPTGHVPTIPASVAERKSV
jgi:hypothetical protein